MPRCTLFLCLLAGLFSPGCAEMNGEVSVESGPPVGMARAGRAECPVYAVHVGERVMMHFECKMGTADYAVMLDGTTGAYSDCGPALKGRFMWPYDFKSLSQNEEPTRMTITAYAQDGRQDWKPIQGELRRSEGPSDVTDRVVAETTFFVRVYQSAVELEIGPESEEPAWRLSRLEMHPKQGALPRIKMATKGSRRRGFTVSGPDNQGVWQIRYEPTVDEINTHGTTSAEFTLADQRGQTRLIHIDVPTP